MIDVSSYFVGLTKWTEGLLFKYWWWWLYNELDKNNIHWILFSFQYINNNEFARILVYIKSVEHINIINQIITEWNKIFFENENFLQDIKLNSYTIPILNKWLFDYLKNIDGIELYQTNNWLFQLISNLEYKAIDLGIPKLFIENEYLFTIKFLTTVIDNLSKLELKTNSKLYHFFEKNNNYLEFIKKEYNNLFKDCNNHINLNYFNTKNDKHLNNIVFYQRISQLFSIFHEYDFVDKIYPLMWMLSKEQYNSSKEQYIFNLSDNKIKFEQKLYFPKFSIHDLDDFHFQY